jgi:hypothetical protein
MLDPAWNVEPIEGIDVNGTSANTINVQNDLMTTFTVQGTGTPAFVLCYTASGIPFIATGGAVTTALTALPLSQPFTDVAQILLVRRIAGLPVGTQRNVLVPAGAAPRLRAQ